MQDSEQQFGSIGRFDPELHRTNAHDAFCDFVSRFQYEYDAIARDPPEGTEDKATWIEVNKRKLFLGRFASINLQRDFEDAVSETERNNLKFTDLVTKMKTRYEPTRNYTLANHQFHRLSQRPEESFDNFSHRLRHEAKSCKFSCDSAGCNISEVMIRDQIVVGTVHNDIRNNALKNQWNLKDLIENGRKMEAAAHSAQRILEDSHSDDPAEISRVRPGKYSRKSWKAAGRSECLSTCKTCSSKTCRGGKACQARHLKCFSCGQKGHFKGSKACKGTRDVKAHRIESGSDSSRHTSASESSSVADSESDEEVPLPAKPKHRPKRVHRLQLKKRKPKQIKEEAFALQPANPHASAPVIRKITKPRYKVHVVVAEKRIKVFADTGADINVMSAKTATKLNLPLRKTRTRIRPFGSKSIRCTGYYDGFVMFNCAASVARFYVVPGDVETLLSGQLCEQLGIIKFNKDIRTSNGKMIRSAAISDEFKSNILEQYPTVFTGVGTLKDYLVHFYVDQKIPPIAQASRPVPFHLQDRFQRIITQMEEAGIIEEHDGPAPWVSNPVLTPKDDGDIRVTIDLREANKAIKATNIPIPRVEEIKAKLSGCTVFSKLDFKSAFHQLLLDEESRVLTVFHAGQRLMRYRKLTMGAKPASGELTKALIPIFANMPGVHVIHDDIIVSGESKSKHDRALQAALSKISEAGMTLNPDKCILRKKEIPFWGMIVTKSGVKPDPAKVTSLKRATRPNSKDEVMSFLCFVQSFGDFIPHLSRKTTQLRSLTKKHKEFNWSPACEKEFKEIKKSLQEDTALRYFNVDLPTLIFVDAHTSGISAILTQGRDIKRYPVAFASRATRPEEQRYPQLDLEAMAVDFALRRFRNFIAGGPEVQIVTDHKPLVSIFKNSRKGSIRTDRIKLRHQDLPYKVVWEPGKSNPADYLSRHALPLGKAPESWREEADELERTVYWLQYSPYTESVSMSRIIEETAKDKTLRGVQKYIRRGGIPKSKPSLGAYRKFQDQITIADGLVMKQDKVILPEVLWGKAIDKAHQGGHPGINNLKKRIRSHFWIPGLNKLAEEKIKTCKMCQQFTNTGSKQPQKLILPPKEAWQEVSIDLFGPMPDSKHVVVIQDVKTRFPDAKIISSTGARHVIPAIADTYARYGHPDKHRTDNGPPFNSKEFREFSDNHGITHRKSYPYHPQANPVETFMKPLGKAMKIAHAEGKDKTKALNNLITGFRCTPHVSTGQSPGDLMFRGGYRRDFPRKILTPEEIQKSGELDRNLKIARQTFVNSSCKRKTSDIQCGDHVLVRNYKRKKFDPVFGPEIHAVIDVFEDGLKLKRLLDHKYFTRHFNDVKVCQGPSHHNDEGQRLQPPTESWWQWEDMQALPVAEDDLELDEEVGNACDDDIVHSHSSNPHTYRQTPLALSRLEDYNNPGYSELSQNS